MFLNTNEAAKFVVGDELFDVEEGTLLMFPGGSVHHHIEMKNVGSGFVHMLGPFEVGGSHGIVGVMRPETTFGVNFERRRQLEGEEGANPSSAISGEIFITGYTNGTDPNGVANQTLVIEWNLEGLSTKSGVVLKDDLNFCDNVKIGSVSENLDEEEAILHNILLAEAAQGEVIINIGKSIESLLGFPLVLRGEDESHLGCDVLSEITVPANETDTATLPDGTVALGTSGAASSISYGLVLALAGTAVSLVVF